MDNPEFDIEIQHALGKKCARCRIYKEDVGEGPKPFDDICNRCFLVIEDLYLRGELEEFKSATHLSDEILRHAFFYLVKPSRVD